MKIDKDSPNDNRQNEKTGQLPYSSPRLLMFGSIADNTAGGSAGNAEGKKGAAKKKRS